MARQKREEIEILSMNAYNPGRGKKSNLLAFFTVRVGIVAFKDCRLCDLKGDYVVNMPQEKGSDDKWYNRVWLDLGDKDDNEDMYSLIAEAAGKYYESLDK